MIAGDYSIDLENTTRSLTAKEKRDIEKALHSVSEQDQNFHLTSLKALKIAPERIVAYLLTQPNRFSEGVGLSKDLSVSLDSSMLQEMINIEIKGASSVSADLFKYFPRVKDALDPIALGRIGEKAFVEYLKKGDTTTAKELGDLHIYRVNRVTTPLSSNYRSRTKLQILPELVI